MDTVGTMGTSYIIYNIYIYTYIYRYCEYIVGTTYKI